MEKLNKEIRVIMIGNHRSVKGGITTVINQFKEYNWTEDNIKIKFISSYLEKNKIIQILYFFICIVKLITNIHFFKPQIIHIHMSYKGSFYRTEIITKIAKKYNINFIIHLHGSEFEKWYLSENIKVKKRIRKTLEEAKSVIVLGKNWKNVLENISKKITISILNNCVSIPNNMTKYSESPKIFLFLGVLIKRKGIFELIEAINELKTENYLKRNILFKIAGSGKEFDEVENNIKKYKLREYIELIGWVNDITKKKLLGSCQCLILPSYNEGLPMAILEAMSYGMPIIATDVGDVSSVVNKENGILIVPRDKEQIKRAIIKINEKNEKEWSKMCESSRNTIIKKFSINHYFEEIKKIYIYSKG